MNEEKEQEGMCGVCAESLWDLYVLPLRSGRQTKPFLHKEASCVTTKR